MYKGKGKLEIRNGIRIIVNYDLIRYYQKLFSFYTYKTVKFQSPMHGSHISIYLPKIHGSIDLSSVNYLNGVDIEFEYHPDSFTITKKNVWMKVVCPLADEIKKKLDIVDKNFLGYHLTILNFKFDI